MLTSTVQHSEHGNGWLIAVIVGLVLWLAALVAALSLDLSPITRNSMAPVASRAVALAQSLPLLGLAALSAASVVVAVRGVPHQHGGDRPARAAGAAGLRDLRGARPGHAAAVGPGRDHAVRVVPARPGRGVQQRRTSRDGARRAPDPQRGDAADRLRQRRQPAGLGWSRWGRSSPWSWSCSSGRWSATRCWSRRSRSGGCSTRRSRDAWLSVPCEVARDPAQSPGAGEEPVGSAARRAGPWAQVS